MSDRLSQASGYLRQVVGFMRADGETYVDQREDKEKLRRTQVSYSALTWQFVIILSLSSSIASFGLMADSAVAIVGAMLIAPLMKPIIAYAYGVVTGDLKLILRASITLLTGVLITMLVAGLMEKAVGLRGPTSEIMARTQPTLIDLGVAIAAGIAASLATVRRNIADTLPGVAIAVALVPPLCVAGIGFSLGAMSTGWGATLLFGVNLIAIVLAASVVFLIDGYGSLRHASRARLLIIFLLACVLSLPLTTALRQLRADDLAQETIEAYLHEQYPKTQAVHPKDLSRVDAIWYPDHVFVFAEIKASESEFTEETCRDLNKRLSAVLDGPVNLKVQLLLSNEIKVYPYRRPGSNLPNYGGEDLVPRR